MGGKNSKAQQILYDPSKWTEVEKSQFYQVMRNTNGQQGNLYHFNVKSHREIDDEVEIYHTRRKAANWVQVIGAKLSSGGFGFCGSQESALVLTQRIPLLLANIPRLNQQQSVVVLYNALRGYNDISQIITPHNLTDRMIGFTRQGQTKVWINQNFGMNYPSHYVEDAEVNEQALVANLVNAIAPHGSLPETLLIELRSSTTINHAFNLIRTKGQVPQNILESNRINVNSYLSNCHVDILCETTPVVQQVVHHAPVINHAPVVNQYAVYQPPQTVVNQSWASRGSVSSSSKHIHVGHDCVEVRSGKVNFAYISPSTFQTGTSAYRPVRAL